MRKLIKLLLQNRGNKIKMILALKLIMPLSFGQNLINHKTFNKFMINNSKYKINLKKMS
jgi:hypothetical protein